MNAFIIVSDYCSSNHRESPWQKERKYYGIDREPWKCVDSLFYANRLPAELQAIRAGSFNHYLGNLSFGTLDSKDDAKKLLMACREPDEKSVLIEVVSLGPLLATSTKEIRGPRFLGIDGYVDGYGSILRLGIFSRQEAVIEFSEFVNSYGLVDTVDDLLGYAKTYEKVTELFDLEPIGDLNLICAFAVYCE